MKAYLKEMHIETKNREVQSKKTFMTCYVEPTTVTNIKEIIVEAKVGVDEEDYNYLVIAFFGIETKDENMDIDEMVQQAADFILPQMYLFIQILDEQIEKQENIFCS
ncbi:hypothetical protein NMU03_14495 [Allocoprobacillus halotolerans]|uniref:Uncharacterized protein n=1 Tax=Allocoprobacillus halotolerans TaxID=2944914 RepID=A0ABY5I326_9FIRM|nr:hypothetical protein [Allocoprobacillus halotolerans]UTY38789.1 hypothetical protein NMU03_14495 [Allocoprobacillus halotolerans]